MMISMKTVTPRITIMMVTEGDRGGLFEDPEEEGDGAGDSCD